MARFIVEGMRTDEASLIAGVRVNHWVSGVAVVIGGIWFLAVQRRSTSDEVAPGPIDESNAPATLGTHDDTRDTDRH